MNQHLNKNEIFMKTFLLFVSIGFIIYILLAIGLSFLHLRQNLVQGISAISIGVIQGYIGYIIYGTKKN